MSNTAPGKPLRSVRRRPSGWRYTLRATQSRDFTLLWLSTMSMVAGYQMQAIAQGYLVYEMTRSAKILGLVSGMAAVPVLCLALVGGAFARQGTPEAPGPAGPGVLDEPGPLRGILDHHGVGHVGAPGRGRPHAGRRMVLHGPGEAGDDASRAAPQQDSERHRPDLGWNERARAGGARRGRPAVRVRRPRGRLLRGRGLGRNCGDPVDVDPRRH